MVRVQLLVGVCFERCACCCGLGRWGIIVQGLLLGYYCMDQAGVNC